MIRVVPAHRSIPSRCCVKRIGAAKEPAALQAATRRTCHWHGHGANVVAFAESLC